MGRPRKNVETELDINALVDELNDDVTPEVIETEFTSETNDETPTVVIGEAAPIEEPEAPEWLRLEMEAGKAALAKNQG